LPDNVAFRSSHQRAQAVASKKFLIKFSDAALSPLGDAGAIVMQLLR
jgi:hypothetical protein